MSLKFAFSVLVAMCAICAAQEISGERIRAHVKFLSSDLLEGRGVGQRGGDLATEYMATQFALAGAKPTGDKGSYFQRVPLVGVRTDQGAELVASSNGRKLPLRWLDDFAGSSLTQTPLDEFEAEAVFVGYGITAPEYHWDDFKGVDVSGKILIALPTEPESDDPKFFQGRTLTSYGRWAYKFEEGPGKRAKGVLVIHQASEVGFPWTVVRNSWGREWTYKPLAPGEPALSLSAWITEEAAGRLAALSGRSLHDLVKAANSRDFRPIPLGIRFRAHLPTKVRRIESRNVAAIVPGSDAALKSEVVLYTAHWDHLGIWTPKNGDSIYNGAVDNATGCGILIELARAWAALKSKPRRSALFLSTTAEEGFLRGSEYYAIHPLVPPAKTALDLNYDAFFPVGRTRDVVMAGAERTTVWPIVQKAAKRLGLTIEPDPRPEQGSYFRTDHFPLAQIGIPAFSVRQGTDFIGKPPGFAAAYFREFNTEHYHQPSDEYHADWDFSGLEDMARLGMLIGIDTANLPKLPTWNPGDEYLPVREKSGCCR